MHEITTPWAIIQFPDIWEDDYEHEIWHEIVCPKGGTAIDIGAHHGFYTTKMAYEVGMSGKVIAIEPNRENREILDINLRNNGFVATVLNCAVSNYDGTGTLFTYGQDGKDSGKMFLRGSNEQEAFYSEFHEGKPAPVPQKDIQVKVTTLDLITKNLARVDLIKIDVEGAELKVIAGSIKTLQKYKPKLIIEVHFGKVQQIIDLIEDILQDDLGYMITNYYYKVTGASNPFAIFEKV